MMTMMFLKSEEAGLLTAHNCTKGAEADVGENSFFKKWEGGHVLRPDAPRLYSQEYDDNDDDGYVADVGDNDDDDVY